MSGIELSDEQVRRYARHIVLPEIGGIGQARLLRARVLVIGAGGLGSPLLLYLAAAGIGVLGVVDDDVVEASNLHRQVLHGLDGIGQPKVESARARLAGLAPDCRVVPHLVRLGAANAADLVEGYDIVADGSDSFATRAAVQDACLRLGRTLVSASVQGVDGQLTTFKPHLGAPHPCLRCLFPEEPSTRALPSCAQGGVLGPAAGVVGCLQVVEVVKELLGGAGSLSGTLLLYDAMAARLDRLAIPRRSDCAAGHG
ncbi:MAG TPA: HesA/MoeB/ThiF family protein [Geminicoccaceae bacterium]|nr:HesA/MoeB/ThiF family protein [Geminicoccus sp.]HMU49638.1 HesA/MoeB/ThiF family protein [Geminicoccaceae bacterium]